MNSNNPKFKELQAVWYQKLERGGFVDIERKPRLPKPDSDYIEATVGLDARREYYSQATQFLYAFDWHNAKWRKMQTRGYRTPKSNRAFHRLVWEMHCEGTTEQEIADATGLSRRAISKHLAVITKIRKSVRR